MAKSIGKAELDLNREELFVCEFNKNRFIIDAMREGIRLGHKFPRVNVLPHGVLNNAYYLIKDFDGGNHRAISHYEEQSLFNVNILEPDLSIDEQEFKHISEVKFIYNLDRNSADEYRLREVLKFFPEDSIVNVCKNKGLDSEHFLSYRNNHYRQSCYY